MITRIALQHFKSFDQVEFSLSPITLIVGTNASGKSNLRDALRVLHGVGLGYSLAEVLGEKYGPGGILQWRGVRGGALEAIHHGKDRFYLEVDIDPDPDIPFGFPYTYCLQVAVGEMNAVPRVVYESLWLRGTYCYDSAPEDDPPRQSGDHQIAIRHPRGGKYRKHGKVSAFSSALPVLSQMPEREREPVFTRRLCTKVLEEFQSIRFLDLDPDAMRLPSQPGQLILGDRGENLSSVLQDICFDPKRKQTLLNWLRALTPLDAVDLAFANDLGGRVLLQLVESNGAKLSAASASDGTLRFLALVAALLSKDTGRIFFFFEEFENGIHPTRLHLLLQLVQQACRQQKIQVLGTTHNPALLAFLDKEARDGALLVYRGEDSPASRVRLIKDLPGLEEILNDQDLGRLHAAGWLEDAAILSEDSGGEATS